MEPALPPVPAGHPRRPGRPPDAPGRGGGDRRRRAPSRGRGYLRDVLGTVRRPVVAGTLALGFARFLMNYGVLTFFPALMVARGVGVGRVGLVVGAVGGVKLLVAFGARRSHGVGPPAVTMAAALLASGLTVAAFVSAASFPLFLALAAVYGLGEGVVAPLQKSVLTRNAAGPVRAGVVSANGALRNAGRTAAPLAVGAVVGARGLAAGFLALGVGGALVAAVLLAAFAYDYAARPAASEA